MKVGIWDNDWIGELEFVQDGAAELVMIDGQEIATIRQVGSNLFRYSSAHDSAFGNIIRSERLVCIVSGLERDGYFVYK